MYGSAYLTAHYLKDYHPDIKKVRVVGMNSICEELAQVGIESVGGENEQISYSSHADFLKAEVNPAVQAVVVGLDTKFNYQKLAMANLAI
jgi:ribonucleotide monophosphatase NagD (HAD superfamily)